MFGLKYISNFHPLEVVGGHGSGGEQQLQVGGNLNKIISGKKCAFIRLFTKYFFIRWMATRKGIFNTCLATLLDTVYAFCIFYYYIQSNISLT